MTIEYERISDYDLPLLRLRQEESYDIGFFGRRYKTYLKENHKVHYYRLLTSQRLIKQIKLVEDEAKQRYESLIKSLSKQAKRYIHSANPSTGNLTHIYIDASNLPQQR